MDEMIMKQLNLYCSRILGEPEVRDIITRKKIKKTKITEKTKCDYEDDANLITKRPSSDNEEYQCSQNAFTDDDYRIISENAVPPDDSDLSDAFEDECNNFESKICPNITEDGFKIQPENLLPTDDSDVSDAFESDLEENTCKNRKQESNNQYKKIKKPLMKLINDFGMEDEIFNKKTEQNNTCRLPSTGKSKNDIKIIDYSHRRGSKKKRKLEQDNEDASNNTAGKEKLDKNIDFRKARYDVYKFGVSGFNKEDKESLKIKMAVRLGARAPKQSYKNYKDILKEKKEQKERELQEKEQQAANDGKLFDGLALKTTKNRKKNNSTPHLDPLKGTFKHGMLKLSKGTIKQMQNRK